MIAAVHGRSEIANDPAFEIGLAEDLQSKYDRAGLIALYRRFSSGPDPVEVMANSFGEALPEDVQSAVRRAPDKRMALALLVASPQFQRR